MRRTWTDAGFVYLVLLLPVLAIASALAWSSEIERPLIFGLLAVLAPSPLVVRAIQGRFDPFEPVTFIALGATVLFVFRPLAQMLSGETQYRGFAIDPTFDRALLVCLVGVVCLYAGYAFPATARWGRRLKPLRDDWSPTRAARFAVCLVLTGLLLYGAFLASAGGLAAAKTFLLGRSSNQGQVVATASAYLYLGPFLAIPATLLFMESAARGRRRTFFIAGALAGLLVVIITGPRGDRIWLLTLLASVVVLPYLRARRRPGTLRSALAVLTIFIVGVTFLRDVRTTEDRTQSPAGLLLQTVREPGQAIQDFMLRSDTEMFAVLSAEVGEIPKFKPFAPGITISSLLAAPVPGSLWPDKPQSPDIQLYSYLFPAQANVTRAGTAPSYFGGLWLDSGFVGIAIGTILFGMAARILYEYLRANPRNASVRLVYAASLPLTIILLRGNLTDTMPRALYLVGPILLCIRVASPKKSQRSASPTNSATAHSPKGPVSSNETIT